jgi:hypothetical protein
MPTWWRSAVNRSFFLCLAACRTRSSAWDTLPRFCARHVLCWLAFPSAPALGSTGSATGRPALFVGFVATMAGSDFSRPCITGYGSSPSRCGPAAKYRRPDTRSPGSRTGSIRTCQGLRPRRVERVLALTRLFVSPSAMRTASAPGTTVLSRLNGWPMRTPADASPRPRGRRRTARGRCGSLLLHRSGLAPPTPYRSPGALSANCRASRICSTSALSTTSWVVAPQWT